MRLLKEKTKYNIVRTEFFSQAMISEFYTHWVISLIVVMLKKLYKSTKQFFFLFNFEMVQDGPLAEPL